MRWKKLALACAVAVAACGTGLATGPVLDLPGTDAGLDALAAEGGEAGVDAAVDAAGDASPDAADASADAAPEPTLLRFAVVGDFGNDSARELAVASMIASWSPELVVTVGDNNYGTGSDSYDPNVGQYYHAFIAPYAGAYGAGAPANAFFPAIGNHDWDIDNGAAYADFFALPGNERYYELDRGPVHFVFIDSDTREPDGTTAASAQGAWAQAALGGSTLPFQIVVFHHPAYTSGTRSAWMDWPFKSWGAAAVLTGHVHNYERLRSGAGLTYFVVGQGGMSTHAFGATHPASQVRYNTLDGAQLVDVTASRMRFRYYAVSGALIDEISLDAAGNPVP